MIITSTYDPYAIHWDSFTADVYTLDTASIILTDGLLTLGGENTDFSASARLKWWDDLDNVFSQGITYSNTANRAAHTFYSRARGTYASKLAVAEDDRLGGVVAQGWDGNSFESVAAIVFEVDGAVSDEVVPSRISFETTSTTFPRAVRMVIDSAGMVSIVNNLLVNTTDFVVNTVTHKVEIGSADGNEKINIFHDDTDGNITWSKGSFDFQTDEGTDTDSVIKVLGKGTGRGFMRVYDEDNSAWMFFGIADGVGEFSVAGDGTDLRIQAGAPGRIEMFRFPSEGDTLNLMIYGHRTGDDQHNLNIGVGTTHANTATFGGTISNYRFAGNVEATGGLTVDTNTFIVNASSHRVGVNIANPANAFVVSGVGTTYMQLTNTANGETAGNGLEFFVTASGTAGIVHRETAGMRFQGGGSVDFIAVTSTIRFKAGNGLFAFYKGDTLTMFIAVSTEYVEAKWGMADNTGNHLTITNSANYSINHDHGLQTDPTMFFHSDLSPNVSNNQWGSVYHDKEDFIIETGVATGAGSGPTTIANGVVIAPRGVQKIKFTAIGGYAVKLTNKTGSNTVAGQLVKADTAVNDAVVLTGVDDDECFGVFLDAGIADGSEAWVVTSGIADIAFDDDVAAVRGNWVGTGAAGYARTQSAPPALGIAAHFEEIGHSIESVTAGGGGTHILGRCILQFN